MLAFVLVIFFIACDADTVDLQKYGMVSGVILDGESFEPLNGVMIATNPASSVTITNQSGNFSIGKVLEGEAAITARKNDYLSSSVSVAVYEDETTSLTFFMYKDERDIGWVEIYDPVPGNGAVDQTTSFTFKWNVDQQNSGKQLDYTVYYFESNSIVQKIAGENLTVKEVVVDGLDHDTTYYWYVVAKYEGDRVANSPTWSFKTQSAD